MNRNYVKLVAILAVVLVSSGCAMQVAESTQDSRAMISAAEFDSMIRIEVRELEPLPVEDAVAAAH